MNHVVTGVIEVAAVSWTGFQQWDGWSMVAALGALATVVAVWYAYQTRKRCRRLLLDSQHSAIEPSLSVQVMRTPPGHSFGVVVSVKNVGRGPAVGVKVKIDPDGSLPYSSEFGQALLDVEGYPSDDCTESQRRMVNTFEWRRAVPLSGKLIFTYTDTLGKFYIKDGKYYLKDGEFIFEWPVGEGCYPDRSVVQKRETKYIGT